MLKPKRDIYFVGYSGLPESLLPFARLYSKGRSIHLIDLPGFHDDTRLTQQQKASLDTYVELVAKKVQRLSSGQQVRLIGHSYGAMVAVTLAAKFPSLVNEVVCINPVVNARIPTRMTMAVCQLLSAIIGAQRVTALLRNSHVVDAVSTYNRHPDWTAEQSETFKALRRTEATAYRPAIVECATHRRSFAEALHSYRYRGPACIVYSANDKIAKKGDELLIKQSLPEATLTLVDGGHHAIVIEPLRLLNNIKEG